MALPRLPFAGPIRAAASGDEEGLAVPSTASIASAKRGWS